MKELMQSVYFYLGYLLKAKHRKGHGIHSPFVFDFVTKVLYDKTSTKKFMLFKQTRSELKKSNQSVEIEEIGAGSKKFGTKTRKIKDMACHSSVKPKYAKLLFRIARYYKPETSIELGTSVGLSALCLGAGHPAGSVISIEGNQALCEFAMKLFSRQSISNIKVIHGKFDDILPELGQNNSCPDLVYIDGNHDYEPTLHYFDHFAGQMNKGILIFDDINWSSPMRRAWKSIVADKRTVVSIELFQMGIVFLDNSISPGHYCIAF